MNFSVNKLLFLSALEKIDTLVSSRDIQTLLANIVIRAEKNKIFLISSDMENTAQIYFEAKAIQQEGEAIVKARKLNDILRNIVGDEIVLQAVEEKPTEAESNDDIEDDNRQYTFNINIHSNDQKSAKYKMTGMSTENFPHIHILPEEQLFSIPSATLKEMIRKTIYSISHEDNRYIYNGLCFQFHGNKFTMVGTDGRRLSAIERELPNSIAFSTIQSSDNEDEKQRRNR